MNQEFEFCLLEKKEHIWIVTINRPEAMNALHPAANFELETIFNDFAADKSAWVAILTGAGGKAFCTGNDLKFQASGGKLEIPETGFAGLTSRFNMDKPVIAAVEGYAMGGGFEIALACDLIVADPNAQFALPEPKVGLAALAGGIHRLTRQIGEKQAMEILLTARRVNAEEGKAMGFVNRISEEGGVMDDALKLAQEILVCSPMSIQMTKQIARDGQQFSDLENAVSHHYDAYTTLFSSNDFIEGPTAFMEKRAPKWSGE
jgi:crotonobetainyl-CoA hydratase